MVRGIGEDEGEKKVIDDIAAHGWHCVHIMAEGDHVEYSFTIGLFHSYGHSELIIFGLPSNVSHQILATAVEAAKSGTPLNLSQPTSALLKDYSCCFAEVHCSEYYDNVGYARWYYEGDDFPLHQIIWPSKTGLFPWHPQASAAFRAAQPVIARGADGT